MQVRAFERYIPLKVRKDATKSDYSLFVIFFLQFIKNNRIIHYFLGSRYSLFIIIFYSLFTFHYKKGSLFTNH